MKDQNLITFDTDKIELIRRTVARDATEDELKLFMHQCQRTGLDPLSKQIYFSKYRTRGGPQVAFITSIDGYRLIADRTGKYAGNDDPVYGENLKHKGKDVPAKATVCVWKMVDGHRYPFTASAHWKEYVPADKKDFMWLRMPFLMLGKVAEALALRKAFPSELSNMYTHEEMDQSDHATSQNKAQDDEEDAGLTQAPEPADTPEVSENTPVSIDASDHWISDNGTRAKFWSYARQDLELTREQVHEALSVESVKDFAGSRADAAKKLKAYAEQEKVAAEEAAAAYYENT
jgi:phage recombination protein Bet